MCVFPFYCEGSQGIEKWPEDTMLCLRATVDSRVVQGSGIRAGLVVGAACGHVLVVLKEPKQDVLADADGVR